VQKAKAILCKKLKLWYAMGMTNRYIPRIYDRRLSALLTLFGGVLVEGPKWCGKTWTSRNACSSELFIADPKDGYATKKLVAADVYAALIGESPRLIDEWQEVPEIWDAVRFEIDQSGQKGKFILTGSSNPPREKTIHSGTGRIARLKMSPMTLYEAGGSNGEISFDSVIGESPFLRSENTLTIQDIAKFCVGGGWPANIDAPKEFIHELPMQYIRSLVNEDISRYDDVQRDPVKMGLLLRSLARNNQTLVSNKTLLADTGQISEPTLNSYMNVLKNLFILDNIPAWSPNVRSRSRLRTNEKVRFVDPSLAIASLAINAAKLEGDPETFGFMFENLVSRDVLAYAEIINAKVFHYREAANQGREELEVDLVVETSGDEYCLMEVKLGANQIDEAEATLLRVSDKLIAGGAQPPKSMVVISGTAPFAYTTERGVKIVPIGCIGA
jgi:predicted AAA+ superfamily ATPase